jgi:6-phosphogluconolactonase
LKQEIKVFDDKALLVWHLVNELKQASMAAKKQDCVLNIVLSGGKTPKVFFKKLTEEHTRQDIQWSHIRLFWGDERLVTPDHPNSNYGMTYKTLLSKVSIPHSHIHRIMGESRSQQELKRYAEEIIKYVPGDNTKLPRFDWIFLGIGTDGHTASIFPKQRLDKSYKGICALAQHPKSGEKRITLTMEVLSNAKRVSFLVTGKSKARVIAAILNSTARSENYPAAQVKPASGALEWYLDRPAASIFFGKLSY